MKTIRGIIITFLVVTVVSIVTLLHGCHQATDRSEGAPRSIGDILAEEAALEKQEEDEKREKEEALPARKQAAPMEESLHDQAGGAGYKSDEDDMERMD